MNIKTMEDVRELKKQKKFGFAEALNLQLELTIFYNQNLSGLKEDEKAEVNLMLEALSNFLEKKARDY